MNFFVEGKPEPGGSKKAISIPGCKFTQLIDANPKAADWKKLVKHEAKKAIVGAPLSCPLSIVVTFVVARPKNHFGTGKNASKLKASAPALPTSKPDATKLFRSTEDAMTGVIWVDDAQIVDQFVKKRYADASKWYGSKPGAHILVTQQGERD